MATVYILYSNSIDRFYIGSCKDLNKRLQQHANKDFGKAFTTRAEDWVLFYKQEKLDYKTTRAIEQHIKKMKSRTYVHNLKKHDEIMQKLIKKYSAGSSR